MNCLDRWGPFLSQTSCKNWKVFGLENSQGPKKPTKREQVALVTLVPLVPLVTLATLVTDAFGHGAAPTTKQTNPTKFALVLRAASTAHRLAARQRPHAIPQNFVPPRLCGTR